MEKYCTARQAADTLGMCNTWWFFRQQFLPERASMLRCRPPAGNIVGALYHKLNTHSSAPEDAQNNFPKHVELTGIINKPLLLHLVGCLYYSYE